MAIKLAGTTIIDDSRNLVNTTGMNGVYTALHPTVVTHNTVSGSINIDFNTAVQKAVLQGNSTIYAGYGGTNIAGGKSTIMLIDRSSNLHTFQFDWDLNSVGFWAGGSAPDFTAYRYWVFHFIAIGVTYGAIRASGAGFSSL